MKLICPVCKKPLIRNNKEALCGNNHHFDYAKSGYLNLMISQKKNHGDNAEMSKARIAFLNTGAYAFLQEKLSALTRELHSSIISDLGCGNGYYTAALTAEEKFGFDLSKDALKYAAKHDPSTQYVVSSIFNVPLADRCADTILTCFAPTASKEIDRLLKDNGYFIYVSPGPLHLIEFKEALYEKAYVNEVKRQDLPFPLVHQMEIENTFHADNDALQNLFMMTPYAFHTGIDDVQKLKKIEAMDIRAQFVIQIYQKNKESA